MADLTEPDDGDSAALPAQRRPSKPAVIPEADRQRMITILQKAAGDGTLTLDEFADRAGMVWAAATSMELEAVVADLPQPTVTTTPAGPQMVGDGRRRKIRRWIVAIMSGSTTKGRWRVGDSVTSVAVMGGV